LMTKQTKSASPMAWALVAASALTLVSCVGGVAWLGWRIAQGPPPDTTVYDPSKPLHENPRTRLGYYNTDVPLEFRWRSADGTSTLHMRIPAAWVDSAGGTRRGLGWYRPYLGNDHDDGVSAIHLRVWLSDGTDGLVATPIKLLRARMAPGQAEIEEPGFGMHVSLEPTFSAEGFRPWADDGGVRRQVDFNLRQSDSGIRPLPAQYGLERYRPQACGAWLPPNVSDYPLLTEEPEKNDGCRDLGNPPEWWLSPRGEADGVAFDCYRFHGAADRRPYCAAGNADYRGWRMTYSIPFDEMHRWREVRRALRDLLASWEVPPSASERRESTDEGVDP
jgi:hypothetical protein